jgi:hypothetical protein
VTEAESPAGVLEELHALLEDEGGLLAESLRPVEGNREVFAPLVAAGESTREDLRGYELVVESIFEGYLLHYWRGRIVDAPDPDLRLLAGDHLYAFGLVRLGGIGDLDAVDELADLISLCAQAHASFDGQDVSVSPSQLTGALWGLSMLAVAGGSWPAQREAKQSARDGSGPVITKVLDAARQRANELGLGPRLEQALIAFQRTVEGELSIAQ